MAQAAIATSALAVMIFLGSCLLGARGTFVMASADRPLIVTSVPASPALRRERTSTTSDLPDATTWARTPYLFGQSAPLRAGFQKATTEVAAVRAPPLLDLAPAPTDTAAPPVQVASLEADSIPLPPIPDSSNLVRDVPLPAPRPADLRAAAGDMRTAAGATPRPGRDRVVDQPPAVAPAPPGGVAGLFDKIFGASQPQGPALAYANPQDGLGLPSAGSAVPPSDRTTAIYDISAKTVYMPDGTRLEAHSGLREMLDDPRGVHVKMRGATPPATYDLTLREKLFHGVQALRLTPVNSGVYGRVGLLAHTYMLGPNGDSNGCVSFRNYEAFLQAFMRGQVRRLVVVARR